MDDFNLLLKWFEERKDDGEPESIRIRASIGLMRDDNTKWSTVHGFFADMGGVRIKFADYEPLPVNSYQLHWLVKNGHIGFPDIDKTTILDKDKADIFTRVVTLLQVSWFTIQCIARGVENLRLTTLEISTVAFSWCAINAMFFWRNKPLDIDTPITITEQKCLRQILEEAGREFPEAFIRTPLDFVATAVRFSYAEPFFHAFQWTLNLDPPKRSIPATTIANNDVIPPHGLLPSDMAFAMIFVPMYVWYLASKMT